MSDTHAVQPDPSMIGGIKTAPFVRLPAADQVFARRAARMRDLAPIGVLGPYLDFLATIADAQAAIVEGTPDPELPPTGVLERAHQHAMPPLDRTAFAPDETMRAQARALFEALATTPKPEPAQAALARVMAADDAGLDRLLAAVLTDAVPAEAVAEHLYAAAALQVHFTRLAAKLDAATLAPVGTGACPCCGGPPAVSMVVGWYGAEGARYAACALCSTLWNEVRVKCLACGSTEGVGLQGIEGQDQTVKAETCDSCHSYLKVLYLDKDTAIEPIADDVASLGLDQLLGDGDYRRAGANPFLTGY
jgi:FdhE protein